MTTSRLSTRRMVCLLAVAGAAALIAVPSAQAATNLVPNPGFETNCSGVPCSWSTAVAASIMRDTTVAHNNSVASIKVTLDGSASTGGAKSDCVNTPVGAGGHLASGYYLTSDPTTMTVQPIFTFYPAANCTGVGTD